MTCQFIPPYLLRQLRDHDSSDTDGCRRTLQVDERLRSKRATLRTTLRITAAQVDAPAGERWVIHSAGNTEQLPGQVARHEGQAETGDPATDEAYAATGQVWDLFADGFGRRSYDGNASPVSVTVHYGTNYDNAFWDGQQLVFGDGDGQIFDRFTKPADVLAHEFTHGFVQFTANLAYQGQSGALNESVADVFAAMTRQRVLGQTADQADWLIGVGLFLPDVAAKALRSMIEPGTAYDDPRLGKDPQVGSMDDYVDTTEDNGGVHLNSGIPNRAFALAAIGLGGSSWERAGRVWFDAMTAGGLGADTDFTTFAEATVDSATRVFAEDPSVADQVRLAWSTVGVLDAAEVPDPDQPPPVPLPARVSVRRSGGFAGIIQSAELDLDADPTGPEVRQLLQGVDPHGITSTFAGADRFVYTLSFGDTEVTLGERDLTPDLSRVVNLVLGQDPPKLG